MCRQILNYCFIFSEVYFALYRLTIINNIEDRAIVGISEAGEIHLRGAACTINSVCARSYKLAEMRQVIV